MVRPKNNLPPESQQWARSVEGELQKTQFDAGKSLQDNTNAFKSINSTMKQVSDQLATLAAQQVTLTTQQATLAAQVADIAALVGAQVTGNTKTASASGSALSSTQLAIATVSVPVPAGFTRAQVMAVSALQAAGATAVTCATSIQGNASGDVTGNYGFASNSHAVTLTGLSGGTISASTLAYSYPDSSSNWATTTLFVLFLR